MSKVFDILIEINLAILFHCAKLRVFVDGLLISVKWSTSRVDGWYATIIYMPPFFLLQQTAVSLDFSLLCNVANLRQFLDAKMINDGSNAQS